MAETQFVLSQERLHAFMLEELGDWKIARDGSSPLIVSPGPDLLQEMNGRGEQLFMKHAAFASDDFVFRSYRYADGMETLRVDQFKGAGHIKLLSFPLRGGSPLAFKVSISYGSFFVASGRHIPPSLILKKNYSSLVRAAKRRTQKSEVFPGRNMWVGTDLLGSDPDIIERVRSSFRRREET